MLPSPQPLSLKIMSRFLLSALLALPLAAQPPLADVERAVRALDDERIVALRTGDLATLRKTILPDATYTHGSGRLQRGDDYLRLLDRGDLRYLAAGYETQATIHVASPETAVVTGRLRLTSQGRNGAPNERIMATTAVYSIVGDNWRLVSYQSTPAPAAPAFTVLDTHLAAKDVCAWPKLTLHADGTVYAAIYNQASHGQTPGDVACWASTDGGLTWSLRGIATRHAGNQAWFNHALGIAANGDLLIATSGWDYESPQGGKVQTPLVPQVVRSSDGGRTWKQVGRFPAAPEPMKAFVPFGNIERGEDGVLRVAAFSYARNLPPPRTDTGYVIASKDDGATWEIQSAIGNPEVNETDLFKAGGNRWLAAARNLGVHNGQRAHSIDLYVSDDNAQTWRKHTRLTQPRQHPGDLLRLADGRILLTYGDRRAPDFGINAMVSRDEGLSWSPEFRLVSGLSSSDSGYPSSVQLADGTIVTAYYGRGSKLYDGYQLSVVRWRLD